MQQFIRIPITHPLRSNTESAGAAVNPSKDDNVGLYRGMISYDPLVPVTCVFRLRLPYDKPAAKIGWRIAVEMFPRYERLAAREQWPARPALK
jgi:hypothetical protein